MYTFRNITSLLFFSISSLCFFACGDSTKNISSVDVVKITDALTEQQWQLTNVASFGENSQAETETWKFYNDGTYRWSFASDFGMSYVGAWSIGKGADKSGVLFLATTRNEPGGGMQYDALSFQIVNSDRIRIDETIFEISEYVETLTPSTMSEVLSEAVRSENRNKRFSLWANLVLGRWESATEPLAGDPMHFAFNDDGTFYADFATTDCTYSGTWSLTGTNDPNRGMLRMSVPAHKCDSRGPKAAAVRGIPILRRSDTHIDFYRTTYVRSLPSD